MEVNGDEEVEQQKGQDSDPPPDLEDELQSDALEIKEEPQQEEMKDYAEDTMNELLGMYGYDGVDKSVTDNLQLHHFAPEDQEGASPAAVDGVTDDDPLNKGALSPNVTVHKVAEVTSTEKLTGKTGASGRKRSSGSSGYRLRESPMRKSLGAFMVNGGGKSLVNRFKSSKSSHSIGATKEQVISSTNGAAIYKKRKRTYSNSSSEVSSCSCGTCGSDNEETHNHGSNGHVDILKEIEKVLQENKSLRKENRKLRAELRESLNVRQLSQDLRHLTSQLQGTTSPTSLLSALPVRPPSTSSASSGTLLKISGSAKKAMRVKQQKLDDQGELMPEGEDDEESDLAEELWPDSGILLPATRIQNALKNAQQNYRLFTRSLMEMVFTKETMAASSARGQKGMGKTAPDNPRPPLDQNAVQAIVSRVCAEFPDVHPTLVMAVIRQKIADVRKRLKIQSSRELAQQDVL